MFKAAYCCSVRIVLVKCSRIHMAAREDRRAWRERTRVGRTVTFCCGRGLRRPNSPFSGIFVSTSTRTSATEVLRALNRIFTVVSMFDIRSGSPLVIISVNRQETPKLRPPQSAWGNLCKSGHPLNGVILEVGFDKL